MNKLKKSKYFCIFDFIESLTRKQVGILFTRRVKIKRDLGVGADTKVVVEDLER